jgi:hypothetical protein
MSRQIVYFFSALFAIATAYGFNLPTAPSRLQRRLALTATSDLHEPMLNLLGQLQHVDASIAPLRQSILLAVGDDAAASAEKVADVAAQVSIYSKVDKTGFIGGIAAVIETVITFFHETLQKAGLENSYGVSIILFTILGIIHIYTHVSVKALIIRFFRYLY